jgi:hypothetical protein
MKNSLLTLSKDAGFIYVNLFFVILYIWFVWKNSSIYGF